MRRLYFYACLSAPHEALLGHQEALLTHPKITCQRWAQNYSIRMGFALWREENIFDLEENTEGHDTETKTKTENKKESKRNCL